VVEALPMGEERAFGRRTLALTFVFVVFVSLACDVYASIDARGVYADAAGLVVVIYELKWFLVSGPRAVVEILRQAPVVLLARYSSATLFEGAQLLTFVMLALPTLLCAVCWWIPPRDRKPWILFPLAYLLIGFAATSMHAVGEAAIATSYYWILFFLLLFRVRTVSQQFVFLLVCIPAFWLHEASFSLTIVLLLAIATHVHGAVRSSREPVFVGLASLLLAMIFAKQIYYVIHPLYPDDRAHIIGGLVHFEFLYVDHHFNLPLFTGAVALLTLLALFFVNAALPAEKVPRYTKLILWGWTFFALGTIVTAIMIERSFSPFSQLQARYHPVMVSTVLGLVMIALLRFKQSERAWMNPAVVFVLISLCATQGFADVAATFRWNAYVMDLQSRLTNGGGLIPWEATLHSGDERADINWRIFKIGWVVPFLSVIFAPYGVVNAMIDVPKGTTFRPLDPERPNDLPEIKGIDFSPYKRTLESARSNGRTQGSAHDNPGERQFRAVSGIWSSTRIMPNRSRRRIKA
jgi:hypothetical protein